MKTNNIYNQLEQLCNNTQDNATHNPLKMILDTLRSERNIRYSTGFENIDAMLKGGLAPETLTILGGTTGAGKTTLALQIAYNISKRYKQDVLFIALEMSEYQMYLKLLSMISKNISEHCANAGSAGLTLEQIEGIESWESLDSNTSDLLIRAAAEMQYNANLYIKSSVERTTPEDINKLVEEHISKTGKAPVLFIDYLHNIKSKKSVATDKQVIDEAVSVLTALSYKYKIPVFAMSSVNRNAYVAPDLAAVKGSGEIEYSASTVLLLTNPETEKKNGPTDSKRQSSRSARHAARVRTVQLTAVKNRYGPKDVSTLLKFSEEYSYFSDVHAYKCL